MNTLTELIRPHVSKISADAANGDQKAQEIIDLYRMHVRCPNDPGAQGLCRAAVNDWLNKTP